MDNKYIAKIRFVLPMLVLAVVATGLSSIYGGVVAPIHVASPAFDLMTRNPIDSCQQLSGLPTYGWPAKYITSTGGCVGIYKYFLPIAWISDVLFYFVIIFIVSLVIGKFRGGDLRKS